MLTALDAKTSAAPVVLPIKIHAVLAELDDGVITLRPRSSRLIADRPIVAAAERRLKSAGLAVALRQLEGTGFRSIVLPPEQA